MKKGFYCLESFLLLFHFVNGLNPETFLKFVGLNGHDIFFF